VTASATAGTASSAAGAERDEILRDLVGLYATALEYPEDVFTEDVELEAELGIDSVKQAELLARVSDQYQLPPKPPEFKLSVYNTLGKVADFVVAALSETDRGAVTSAAEGPAPFTPPAAASVPPPAAVDRDALFARIVSIYAEALEYPQEVFAPDVALEAELGIDSVKQTELLARVSDVFGLPDRPADFKLTNYDTLRKVADFVYSAAR
jgi:acyl carrier protein